MLSKMKKLINFFRPRKDKVSLISLINDYKETYDMLCKYNKMVGYFPPYAILDTKKLPYPKEMVKDGIMLVIQNDCFLEELVKEASKTQYVDSVNKKDFQTSFIISYLSLGQWQEGPNPSNGMEMVKRVVMEQAGLVKDLETIGLWDWENTDLVNRLFIATLEAGPNTIMQ